MGSRISDRHQAASSWLQVKNIRVKVNDGLTTAEFMGRLGDENINAVFHCVLPGASDLVNIHYHTDGDDRRGRGGGGGGG